MASRGLPASSKATASEVEQFSDATVRFMQLVYIFTDLVPKVLLDVLTHHIPLSKAFQKKFGKKPWDGGQKHRVWLATMMKKNEVQDFSCAAVRKKPASKWDVTNLSAALSAVMEPSGDPCDVAVNQWCGKKDDEYFNVVVPASKRHESIYWRGFNINVTGASLPEVVECVVTKVPSDTPFEAACREKASKCDLSKKTKKYRPTERRSVYFPLPEVQDIVNVRQSRNAVYHRSKTEVSGDEFEQHVKSVRHLIKHALHQDSDDYQIVLNRTAHKFCDGYRAELERAACTENFRERFRNVKDLAELIQMLKHMKEDVQVEVLKEGIEALCSEMGDRFECLQNVVQEGHKDIKKVARKGFAAIRRDMKKVKKLIKALPSQLNQSKDTADVAFITRLVNVLYEADDLAREFHRLYPHVMTANLCTSEETAAYAYALQHHPSLEKLNLFCPMTGSVNLQPLLDALSHHPTVRELYIEHGHEALCQFLRGNHRLAKVDLNATPVEVVVAALSTESSTMEELICSCPIPVGDDATGNLLDCLRSTSLRCIAIWGTVGKVLLPILRGLAANTKTVDRTVWCLDDLPVDLSPVSQLAAELRQFLVPCVNCDLTMPLPVGVWGSLLSRVGDAKQLEWLRVGMRDKAKGAGPELDDIDPPTLEEVEKSWKHSWCGEAEVNISGCYYDQRFEQWSKFPNIIQGSTLDATMRLLCAIVRGIIQRKDQFVLKLQVNDEHVSRLAELEDIAENTCAVTRAERVVQAEDLMTDDFMEYTLTVLELKPLSSDQKGKSPSSQPPAKRSRQRTRRTRRGGWGRRMVNSQSSMSSSSQPPAKRSRRSLQLSQRNKSSDQKGKSSSSQPPARQSGQSLRLSQRNKSFSSKSSRLAQQPK